MRFLLDANMPRSVAGAVQRLGHEAVDVRDIGLGGAEDQQVAAYAKQHDLALITRDFDFSDVRNYPPAEFAGIIVLELPDDAVAATVVKVMESFLSQPQLLSQLKGRLAIVESWRVRFRPTLP
jgi:predicted nuclease of predicted toxin-antitoxin system